VRRFTLYPLLLLTLPPNVDLIYYLVPQPCPPPLWSLLIPSSIYRKVISPIPVPASLAAPSESSSYVIRKGDFIVAAPGVSAMDPRIWNDATTWEPSRWTDEKGVGVSASAAYSGGEQVDYGYGVVSKGTESPYQPFGAGRHR
jgi:sterol 14-demethylase